jgi:hypothetical protein
MMRTLGVRMMEKQPARLTAWMMLPALPLPTNAHAFGVDDGRLHLVPSPVLRMGHFN